MMLFEFNLLQVYMCSGPFQCVISCIKANRKLEKTKYQDF